MGINKKYTIILILYNSTMNKINIHIYAKNIQTDDDINKHCQITEKLGKNILVGMRYQIKILLKYNIICFKGNILYLYIYDRI